MKAGTLRERQRMIDGGREDIHYSEFLLNLEALGYSVDEEHSFCSPERGKDDCILVRTAYIIEKDTLLSFNHSRARRDGNHGQLLRLLGSIVCLHQGHIVLSQ